MNIYLCSTCKTEGKKTGASRRIVCPRRCRVNYTQTHRTVDQLGKVTENSRSKQKYAPLIRMARG